MQYGIYKKLGMLLQKMHQVKSVGYSNIVNDKMVPEYTDVGMWLMQDTRTKSQFEYVKENSILAGVLCESIETICERIVSIIGNNTETVYCHNDFHTGNIFITEPYTVFDPWPCFNHPYFDLARSVVLAPRTDLCVIKKHFVEGYFGEAMHDEALLEAFIMLNIWLKLPYMHKTNKLEDIQIVKEYLSKNKKI